MKVLIHFFKSLDIYSLRALRHLLPSGRSIGGKQAVQLCFGRVAELIRFIKLHFRVQTSKRNGHLGR